MFRSSSRLGGTAPTLGVIVDWLGDPYQAAVCDGISAGARYAGENLLYFVGGTLPLQSDESSPRHKIYELAGPQSLDGIVLLSSTLGHNTGREGVAALAGSFAPVPVASVGVALDGYPSVSVNNSEGMGSAVQHLVSHHQAKRIAFLSGPTTNVESAQRLAVYQQVLANNDLEVNPAWVAVGNFMGECVPKAVNALLAQSQMKLTNFDAIVAANDNMALALLEELTHRGLCVPRDLAVVGFDDSPESRISYPPLTTVSQPMGRVGLEAVRRVRRTNELLPTERNLLLGTQLCVRQSCGCTGQGPIEISPPKARKGSDVSLFSQIDRIEASLARAARGLLAPVGAGWEKRLLGHFIEELSKETGRFVLAFEEMADRLSSSETQLTVLDDVISALRRNTSPLLVRSPERLCRAEDLFHAARLANGLAVRRTLGRAHLQSMHSSRAIVLACNELSSAPDQEALCIRFRDQVPRIGIRSGFIVVYRSPGEPRVAQIISAFGRNESYEVETVPPFDGRRLLPDQLAIVSGEGRSFAVLPLVGKSQLLGHVILEYLTDHAFACGVLANAISTSLGAFAKS